MRRDAPASPPSLLGRRLRRAGRALGPVRRRASTLVFLALVIGTGALGLFRWHQPNAIPGVSLYMPLVVLAGLFLRPVVAAVYYIYVAAWVSLTSVLRPATTSTAVTVWSFVSLVIVMGFMLWISRSRERLGVVGVSGESMFVDLRDRLRRGGELPDLPAPWYAEAALNSAYGSSFSGDFMLTNLSTDGKHFEVALVDVSGKGSGAGTRALLLSGAFGGLLGSVRPEEFLCNANSYLIRQQWDEGFATCVHLDVDLATGRYSVGCAGHPPPAQYLAGSGRWALLEDTTGPLLGVIGEGAVFTRSFGVIRPGDALLLYTDGVVEARHRDFADGVDRMLGVAEPGRNNGFRGLATAVCRAARAGETDDKAVVLVTLE